MSHSNNSLTLVVPLGVEKKLYPWGVTSIRDFVGAENLPYDVEVWDLRDDDNIKRICRDIEDIQSEIFSVLKKRNRDVFDVNRVSLPFSLLACLGAEFFSIAEKEKLIVSKSKLAQTRRQHGQQLDTLKQELESYIAASVKERANGSNGSSALWGISVYDRTLFDCLWVSKLIRENAPDSTIILGGDYFDYKVAKDVIDQVQWVDGAVVGYGEEVMRQITHAHYNNQSAREIRVEGLVNKNSREAGDEPSPSNTKPHEGVAVPLTYKNNFDSSPISYVKMSRPGEIRMLTQRGCSWGKCEFCTQLDRMLFFPIQPKKLFADLKQNLDTCFDDADTNHVFISIDSDENATDTVIEMIRFLSDYSTEDKQITLKLWFQIKEFTKELANELLRIKESNLKVHLEMNVETLNPGTLKHMKKGHTTLRGLECVKAAIDAGCTLTSNYFNHYPLEDTNCVGAEAEVLRSSMHLYNLPSAELAIFPYCANDRDIVFTNQDKYRVSVVRMRGDKWLKNVFGIDLPFSLFSYNYTQQHPFVMEQWLSYTYHEAIKAKEKREMARVVKWGIIHGILALISRKTAYIQRARIFRHILKLDATSYTPEDEDVGQNKVSRRIGDDVRQPHYFIRGNGLYKDYDIPGCNESWSLALDKHELDLLRFMYWTRSQRDVMEQFKEDIGEAEINRIIDRHLKLGTIMSYKQFYLCVANDPEYLWIQHIRGNEEQSDADILKTTRQVEVKIA